jgi:beta-lactamase class A
MPMKLKKTNWLLTVILCLTTGLITYAVTNCFHSKEKAGSKNSKNSCDLRMNLVRSKGYKFISPLLLADTPEPDSRLSPIQEIGRSVLESSSNSSQLQNASFYFRDLSTGSWTGLNEQQPFDPGSILKLSILIGYLKWSEAEPGILNKQILYDKPVPNLPHQNISGKSIQIGKVYSFRQLIEYMILESDNQANAILNWQLPVEYGLSVFSDLGLRVPDKTANSFPMSSSELSRFLRSLYNATYLNKGDSEWALDLLTKTKFGPGIRSGIPEEVAIAHKFGERGYQQSSLIEVHETAIVYLEDKPFLLTIMTKGTDQNEQIQFIRTLTERIYSFVASQNTDVL